MNKKKLVIRLITLLAVAFIARFIWEIYQVPVYREDAK